MRFEFQEYNLFGKFRLRRNRLILLWIKINLLENVAEDLVFGNSGKKLLSFEKEPVKALHDKVFFFETDT